MDILVLTKPDDMYKLREEYFEKKTYRILGMWTKLK